MNLLSSVCPLLRSSKLLMPVEEIGEEDNFFTKIIATLLLDHGRIAPFLSRDKVMVMY
jgi:hypothetical protein